MPKTLIKEPETEESTVTVSNGIYARYIKRPMDFILSVLYMGIGSCVIAFLCMTYAAANLPIAVSASTANFNTVITIFVGVLILHEKFRVVDIIGTVLILLGVYGMSRCYNAADRTANRYQVKGKAPDALTQAGSHKDEK